MAERVAPAVPWPTVLLVALAVIVLAVGGWEVAMRAQGMTADIGDSPSHWARERRKIDGGAGKVVIVGSSRLQFDVDLARWGQLTGTTPIQLARRGTTPRPVIHDLAVDPRFRGLLVVGYDPLVFFGPPGFAKELLGAYHKEPLYRRAGLVLYDGLASIFAFLDEDYTPLSHVLRWKVPQRTKMGAWAFPWKLSESGAGRETWLWSHVETDTAFRDRAAAIWLGLRGPPVKPEQTAKAIADVAADVALIRRHGGEVIFVRAPSDPPLLAREDQVFPRAATWDVLVRKSGARGVYYADVPALARFHTVEYSHLARHDRAPFTEALVGAIGPEAKGR